ncbi:MAG: hypothetical protein R3D57_19355 [Hyphomicrobiaceae bacterium]
MTRAFVGAAQRIVRSAALLISMGLAAGTLAGCGNDSVFGGGADSGPQAAVAPEPQKAKLAFVPLIGAPANVSAQLTAGLVSEVQKQGIPVAQTASEAADYTVKGYIVAAPEKSGSKLSYIWDISDRSGQRAHRITGEEFAPGKAAGDPWSTVDAGVLSRIAASTATQLAAWVPTQPGGASAPLVAGGTSSAGSEPTLGTSGGSSTVAGGQSSLDQAGTGVQAANVQLGGSESAPLQSGQVLGDQASAALTSNSRLVWVPEVVGAPGDGQVSLTRAIRKQLVGQGYQVTETPTPGAFSVKGKVSVAPAEGGKQKIVISWAVHDPAGQYLNSAKQNPVIPQGSLDGAWGRTAEAAAAGAVPKIVKIMKDGKRAASN